MASRKKSPRKKAPAKPSAVEMAWRGKYEEAVEEIDELKTERGQLQASLDAVLDSQFRVPWEEKAEELGPKVVDHLRVILTTSRQQGRTRMMLEEVKRLAYLEDGPPFLAVIAAHHEHRLFLKETFHGLANSASHDRHREMVHGTRVDFVTTAEEEGQVLRGLPGLIRFVDHFTVEYCLRRLCREKP